MNMRNLRTVIIALALSLAMSANAQLKVGLKGGLNISDFSFSEDMFKSHNRTGFFVGPTLRLTLPLAGLGIDAAALYNQREAELSEQSSAGIESMTVRQKSIDIPVNLRYDLGLGSSFGVFAFAGPQWSINVGDDNFKWDSSSSYSLKKSTVSVNVGFGVCLSSCLQLSANYNVPCGKSGEVSFGDGVKAGFEGRHKTWQIAAAFYF